MKRITAAAFSVLLALFSVVPAVGVMASEKPVQHLKLADITSYEEAKQVFAESTAQIKTKTILDAAELHDIHMITYSLEKAVAYFVDNLEAEQKVEANRIAQVVELVHLASENNRDVETRIYLEEYFKLAEVFSANLK